MIYQWLYRTPDEFDDILLSSDGEYLTGLWFAGSRDAAEQAMGEEKDLPIFRETCAWLDIYFGGREPDFVPKYRLQNLTSFRAEVMTELRKIPFGGTTTYGEIAKAIARARGLEKMSSQAVGGAVGWNPLCLIIPCHRVVGAQGNLTGYGGGMKNKVALLRLEGNEMRKVVQEC